MNLNIAILQILAINAAAFTIGEMQITGAYKQYRVIFGLNVFSCVANTLLLVNNISN